MGIDHTTTLHDVANAFPSPEHAVLHYMVDEVVQEGDRGLMKIRCSETDMVVSGHGGREVAV